MCDLLAYKIGRIFALMYETNKCTQIKYALPYITIHLHISVAFRTIIRVRDKLLLPSGH
jgi:hypothetical protein